MVFHVCSIKKLMRYIQYDGIRAPVRAWKNIEDAQRFSTQTGRQIILRLKFPDNSPVLDGHRNQAVVLNEKFPLSNIFSGWQPFG